MSKDGDLVAGLTASAKQEADRIADPYSYSELVDYSELDTWRARDALMLMAGIAPTGADIVPSYENFLGVRVDAAKLVNAQQLTEGDSFYLTPWDLPDGEDDAMTPVELSEVLAKREKLRKAEQGHRRIMRLWESDPEHPFLTVSPPQKFLEWVHRKNVDVPCRAWYEERTSSPKRQVDQVPSESKTDLISVRAETTFLNVIGGLLGLLLGKTPAGKKHSVFENQSAIIESSLATYPGKPGIAKRTLGEKFAKAHRAIDVT